MGEINQILLFVLFLIVFLYLIGIVRRRMDRADRAGSGELNHYDSDRIRYETEPEDETPGIEWEVTEGEAMLRQLADHCKENPGEVSKLIKTWIVGQKNS